MDDGVMEPESELTTTSIDGIADMQAKRLPQLATRMKLALRPGDVLDKQTVDDALELSAAEVVESGREFAQVNESERKRIFERWYEYARQRNLTYLHAMETLESLN